MVILSGTTEQSNIVLRESMSMVNESPQLKYLPGKTAKHKKRLRLWNRPSVNRIEYTTNKSVLKILACLPENAAGHNISTLIIDEFATLNAHAREVMPHFERAGRSRPDNLAIWIGHAGFDLASLGYDKYQYSRAVADGTIVDPYHLPIIYTIPEDLDPWEEANWHHANPSLGTTFKVDSLRQDALQCANNPTKQAEFLTLSANRWVGSASAWLPGDVWAKCADAYTEEELEGYTAYIGIDTSIRSDLTAYTVIVEKDGLLYLLPRSFIPEDCAARKAKVDKQPYTAWARDPSNHFYLTPGDVIDPTFLTEKILADYERFNVQWVAYDPYNFELLRQSLEFDYGLPMIEVRQNRPNMSAPIEHFYSLCLEGKLRHPNNPVLNMCLNNARPGKKDQEERYLLEKASDTQRIDCITASVIAVAAMLHDYAEGSGQLFF